MGRSIRTNVPMSLKMIKPTVPDFAILRKREQKANDKQKNNFDRRHKAHSLTSLNHGDRLWLPSKQMSATVQADVGVRSYELTGIVIRRRSL